MTRFFESVCHVMKDSGIFVYADFRMKREMPELEKMIDEYFEVVKSEDVRRNVL